MTIIECEECESKLISSNYSTENACQTCQCGNIQIIFINSAPPSKLKGLVTVRYRNSYPKIYEISEGEKYRKQREEERLKKTKKLGFQN